MKPIKKKHAERQGCSDGKAATGLKLCRQCGTCCKKGGPALHEEDLHLILEGHITVESLITFRKGEMALFPFQEAPRPINTELVKLRGKKGNWECLFFDETHSACSIYNVRPLECRLFECQSPDALLAVIEKGALTRVDILGQNKPLLEIVTVHEQDCSVECFEGLISEILANKSVYTHRKQLSEMMERDLELRSQAVSAFGLSVATELFAFGRPLFKLLESRRHLLSGHTSA